MNYSNVSRRRFLQSAALSCAAWATCSSGADASDAQKSEDWQTTCSFDKNRVRIYSNKVAEKVKILQISDAHLYLDDERGDEFKEFSGRMAKAYNNTRNVKTNEPTNPIEMFRQIADEAQKARYDALALTGDIISFPTAAGVDFVRETLAETETPYYYVSGNHDWHFEGMPGTERDLRDEWIETRLKSLYPDGANPLIYARTVKGVKFLFVDDSIYEILPEQLDALQKELSANLPTLVFMHVPLYAPGRSVGFGVGHPGWNAKSDGNYKIERRPQWPESGHTKTTFDFRDALLQAPNVLGVFTGHIHVDSLDLCSGKPLHVAQAAVDGSTFELEIEPYPAN